MQREATGSFCSVLFSTKTTGLARLHEDSIIEKTLIFFINFELLKRLSSSLHNHYQLFTYCASVTMAPLGPRAHRPTCLPSIYSCDTSRDPDAKTDCLLPFVFLNNIPENPARIPCIYRVPRRSWGTHSPYPHPSFFPSLIWSAVDTTMRDDVRGQQTLTIFSSVSFLLPPSEDAQPLAFALGCWFLGVYLLTKFMGQERRALCRL